MKPEATQKCDHEGKPTGKRSWLKVIGIVLILFGAALAVAAQVSQALEGLNIIGVSFEAFGNAAKIIALGALFYSGEVLGLADRVRQILGGGG